MTGETIIEDLHCPSTLEEYASLGTSHGPEFDQIVEEAAAALGTPIALISLLNEDGRWFKARVGLTLSRTPLAIAFCTYTVRGPGVFQVADAARDERFANNPLVTGPPYIRFYAGVPLQGSGGLRVGTLCVIDDQPRSRLQPGQEDYLKMLSVKIVDLLEGKYAGSRAMDKP